MVSMSWRYGRHMMHLDDELRGDYGYLGRIRALRLGASMTQAEVGARLGMAQSQYAAIERGARELTTDVLVRICRLFDVRANFVLGLDGPRFDPASGRDMNALMRLS